METDERVEMLLYEAGLLREERKLLSRDYSRLPTSELENLGDDMSIFQVILSFFSVLLIYIYIIFTQNTFRYINLLDNTDFISFCAAFSNWWNFILKMC
ncbi:unnamed protein product [Trichobilharzia regenti]|nr:unnamed protein product [Trichobilharzia regenti]